MLYLLKNGKATPQGFDLRGTAQGNSGLYVQALVTIVLSEAMAMNEAARRRELKSKKGKSKRSRSRKKTKRKTIGNRRRVRVSKQLAAATKLGIYFIVNAQSNNGGWRYRPGTDSDTSVVGWQVMALASAHSAGIRISPKTVRGVNRYLNSVQTRDGSRYGYVSPRPTPAMTAVGLLCRLYLGWRRGNPGIHYGVRYLSSVGPSRTNMYYNYYATQVMHQYGGEMWKKWNKVMRDQLVATQLKTKGHANGSWNVTDPHGGTGGRLYQTCLSIMTLEVYYRHLPLYAERDLKSETEADGFSKKSTKNRSRKGKRKSGKTNTSRKKPVAKK